MGYGTDSTKQNGCCSVDSAINTYVMLKIERQLENRLNLKRKWNVQKVGPLNFFRRVNKWMGYALIGRSKLNPHDLEGTLRLGADEFGRNIAAWLELYLDLLRKRGLKIHSLLVLGSRAKQRYRRWSDTDVFLITDQSIGQNRRLLSDIPLFLGVEVQCYSKKEIGHMMDSFDLTFLDAVYWGVVIYDDGFWSSTLRVFREIELRYGIPRLELKRKLIKI